MTPNTDRPPSPQSLKEDEQWMRDGIVTEGSPYAPVIPRFTDPQPACILIGDIGYALKPVESIRDVPIRNVPGWLVCKVRGHANKESALVQWYDPAEEEWVHEPATRCQRCNIVHCLEPDRVAVPPSDKWI